MNSRAHVIIYGDVIGVGFRSWTVQNARELGLNGWVRNVSEKTVYPDSAVGGRRVEAVFEGPKEKVEEMIKRCNKGPEVAWVEKVDVSWEENKGEWAGFEVRY